MATFIEIWKSSSGISDEDFLLFANLPDVSGGNQFHALDIPVKSGQLYIYKARRHSDTTGQYSAWSPLVFMTGPWPQKDLIDMGQLNTNTTITNPGFATKCGIGVQPNEYAAVKAARLLELVSCGIKGGPSRIKSKAIRNHPGIPRYVLGNSTYAGPLVVEVTPESTDELLGAFFGAPVTTAVSAPATPSAPTVANVGVAGAVNASYTLIAHSPQGDSVASAAGTTATGNATLNGTNYNKISWNAVAGATSYTLLKGGQQLASNITQLFYNDQGAATVAYVAPSAPTGNQQLWNPGASKLPVTLQLLYGVTGLYRIFAGVSGNKLQIKFDEGTQEPFTLSTDVNAIYEVNGFTASQVGLDVATNDPLAGYGIAPACYAQIAGALADASNFDVTIDRNLAAKRILWGSTAPAAYYLQEGQHKITATFYWSTDAEKQRFYQQTNASGTYSHANGVNYFPITITVTNPVNGGGVVNQFIIYFPAASYDLVGEEIKGKECIMQQVEITPYIDPVTGNDVQIMVVNSRSNGSIITPATSITGFNAGILHPYSN